MLLFSIFFLYAKINDGQQTLIYLAQLSKSTVIRAFKHKYNWIVMIPKLIYKLYIPTAHCFTPKNILLPSADEEKILNSILYSILWGTTYTCTCEQKHVFPQTSTNDNFNFYGVKDKTRIQKRLQIERGASVHMHKKPIHTIKLENFIVTLKILFLNIDPHKFCEM